MLSSSGSVTVTIDFGMELPEHSTVSSPSVDDVSTASPSVEDVRANVL